MATNAPTPPHSNNNESNGGGRSRARFQLSSHAAPHQPFIHQHHQSFPSSTSSFSIRHSTSTSSLLGPNETARISFLQNSFHGPSSANSHASSNYYHLPHGLPSSYDRRSFQGMNGAGGYGEHLPVSFGTGTRSLYASAAIAAGREGGRVAIGGTRGSSNSRPRASTTHEAILHDVTSDYNSLYTIDNTTPSQDPDGLSDSDDDGVSYFGTAGQDFLLKKKRAQRSRVLYWIDLIALVIFLSLAGLVPPGSGGSGDSSRWTWTWARIPWPLTVMAIIRILLMAFTARYSHGNYNATVIFACVVRYLLTHLLALLFALFRSSNEQTVMSTEEVLANHRVTIFCFNNLLLPLACGHDS